MAKHGLLGLARVLAKEGTVARVALFLAAFPTNALTGQSVVVSHGWHMV